MPRELLLLRHGKSDWKVDVDDYHRPLKNRGKRGAQRIGVWLSQHGLIPDLILSSPAERALTTAQKCCKVMGIGSDKIQQDERIYQAGNNTLLKLLAECPPEAQRVLLVGHNPGLERLLNDLADEPPQIPADGKLMPTAALAHLTIPGDWSTLSSGQAKLLKVIRQDTLNKKFPFPTPGSEELRDRPAYYYTQSSVIPYRMTDGALEIVIVRSSNDNHWVVPKGIAEPGLTLQESAAKEAWEEAGVEGDVADEALGTYVYEKWGATATVTVYPMAVTRQIPKKEWEERHRGRLWTAPEDAAALLKQKELVPMIMALQKQLMTD